MGLSRYYKNETVRVVAAAAAGYALNEYAPGIKSTATGWRKAVQGWRKSIFKGQDNTLKTSAQEGSFLTLFSGARPQDVAKVEAGAASREVSAERLDQSSGGGLWGSLLGLLRSILA